MDLEDGLEKLLHARYSEASFAFERCKPLPLADALCRLTALLDEQAAYALELSRGNLSAAPPGPDNAHAASLKHFHTKLKRLARQLLMAGTGYPVPTVDYMGDLSQGLDYLITQSRLHRQQADRDRDHDPETGLLNRKAFARRVYDILLQQPNQVGVLFCCVLDNIKYINATHGYDCGDAYIAKVVEVLRACEGHNCLVARSGGNEFAVYAHGFDNEEDAFVFAQENTRTLFNTEVPLPMDKVKIRASCGLAIYPHDATTSDILLSYASHAMFEVREMNRGALMRFSPEVYRAKATVLGRQERLDELIEGKLIQFAFQPIVRLRDGRVTGYEALMRSKIADFASPLDILTQAETQSKLSQLEKVTFEVIFDWVYKNQDRLEGRKIFFNTISIDYLDIDALRSIHPHYESISRSLVFEILENATIESMLLEKVNALRRELSTLIAIDDFGCGHSNALRLISIAPDILKVDRFFINSLHQAPATKRELLSNILEYCRAQGIKTLAEGVETREELISIVHMGFDYAQGFYLGRPDFQLNEVDRSVMEEIASSLRS